jgi:chromosome segregation ATPase
VIIQILLSQTTKRENVEKRERSQRWRNVELEQLLKGAMMRLACEIKLEIEETEREINFLEDELVSIEEEILELRNYLDDLEDELGTVDQD